MKQEEQVREWRRLLRLKGYPTPRDAWRLAALLHNEIQVEVNPVARAYALRGANGKHIVTIPEHLTMFQAADVLLEEIGHFHDEQDMLPRLPVVRTSFGRFRLAMGSDDRAECEASRFVLAWKLPIDILDLTAAPEETAALAGCNLCLVHKRLQLLAA